MIQALVIFFNLIWFAGIGFLIWYLVTKKSRGSNKLFRPAWQGNANNKEKALRAVAKISNQEKLALIAGNPGTDYYVAQEVRMAAAAKLSSQPALAHVAKSRNTEVALYALERIVDEQLLLDVVLSGPQQLFSFEGKTVPEEAVKKISNQQTLEYIAAHCKDATARREAANRITNQAALEHIMNKDGNYTVSFAAAKSLLALAPQFAPAVIDKIFKHVVATGNENLGTGIEPHLADPSLYNECLRFLNIIIPSDVVGSYSFNADKRLAALAGSKVSKRVQSNLLHLIERVRDVKIKVHSATCHGDTWTQTVSFDDLKEKAQRKLKSNPCEYNVDFYRDLLK